MGLGESVLNPQIGMLAVVRNRQGLVSGHDDRAKQYQPVRACFGPRFYDWQLAQSPEESWRKCHRHARDLLGEAGYAQLLAEIEESTEHGARSKKYSQAPGTKHQSTRLRRCNMRNSQTNRPASPPKKPPISATCHCLGEKSHGYAKAGQCSGLRYAILTPKMGLQALEMPFISA